MTELEFSELDRHFAKLMMRLARCNDSALAIAASLASRATADGDASVQLSDFAGRAAPGLDATAPALPHWIDALRASPVVGAPGEFRPLVLDDSGRLYLYRYWNYEHRLAEAILARAADAEGVDDKLLRAGLDRYFPDARDVEQRLAAAMAVMRRFCVISGGPGTGKTTTVMKILALLNEQARGRKLAIGLAAPTGKAAARMQTAMIAALQRPEFDLAMRATIPPEACTLHRLLGARPDSIDYRHNRENPLPLDVLVVDEASMADLALATKLLEALPPRARLILLGDKDQLASVEAGAVLGDICARPGLSAGFAKRLAAASGVKVKDLAVAKNASALSDSVALLKRSYRFSPESGIGTLARLVNAGQGSDALALLKSGAHADLAWRTVSPADLRSALRAAVGDHLRAYFDTVRSGREPGEIFERFNDFRILCARRTGLLGVVGVNRLIEEALEERRVMGTRSPWYPGRPVMITRNDYNLRVFNGDVGIALPDPQAEGQLKIFFPAGAEGARGVRKIAPARLPDHETAYAMTIHKSQGSEFGRVLMVLPGEPSPIMSRELVYTGITRAAKCVDVWGNEETFSGAVAERLSRSGGLRDRLWRC